jgi:hypothetical protein
MCYASCSKSIWLLSLHCEERKVIGITTASEGINQLSEDVECFG